MRKAETSSTHSVCSQAEVLKAAQKYPFAAFILYSKVKHMLGLPFYAAGVLSICCGGLQVTCTTCIMLSERVLLRCYIKAQSLLLICSAPANYNN